MNNVLIPLAKLPHPVYSIGLCFKRAYLAYYKQDKLFENILQCGKHRCKPDMATRLKNLKIEQLIVCMMEPNVVFGNAFANKR